MFYRSLLLFFVILFLSLKASAAVFVVTSNADSGPGTLRDALTQAAANGSAEKDYINFNLPDLSEAGRTIALTSQLPYISSNLVIDGTSQPGNNFGRSNAKIIVQPNTASPFDPFILLDVDGFEIYGLYIRDFVGQISYYPDQSVLSQIAVMYVETSKNIQIGAPGKGNVFAHNNQIIANAVVSLKNYNALPAYGVENLNVFSNFIGFEPDGKTYRGDVYNDGEISLDYCKGDIEIGGDDVSKRNYFAIGQFGQYGVARAYAFPTTINIKNNYFNFDIDGKAFFLPNSGTSIHLATDISYLTYDKFSYPYTISVINNKFLYPSAISCGSVTGETDFKGNELLEAPTTNPQDFSGTVSFFSDTKVMIGGEGLGEANKIFGTQLYLYSPKSILIQHNSIYCVNDPVVWLPGTAYLATPLPLPIVSITNVTATEVGGTATPLSKIELFWDDDCQYCQPLTYVATVNADANGNWMYNGEIKKGVIASATLNGFTSLFTRSATSNFKDITHYSCGNGGTITAVDFQNVGGYQWKNSNNEIIGTGTTINNLLPGNYTLTALNGTCSTDYSFTILNATPKVDDNNKQIIQPSCNKSTGSITGIYLDNFDVISDAQQRGIFNIYTYRWLDANENEVGTDLDLYDVPVGSYHLEVSYQNQCAVTYGPIVLKNITGPNIDQSKQAVTSSPCSQSTGSIKNITVTGTGNITYSWTNDQQQQVGTDKDLLNQPGGTYKLQVMDDTQCGPVYTSAITIPVTNGITIDESKAQVSFASCSADNGSILGIVVTGAAHFVWTDAQNNKIITVDPRYLGVAPGDYFLTATNEYGCSVTSKIYHVGQQAATHFPAYPATVVKSCAEKDNGSVSVPVDALVKSIRWENSQGATISTATSITGLAAGAYKLYLTDENGCEQLYNTYTVGQLPAFVTSGQGTVVSDQCGLKTGGINGITVSGGLPPYAYKWINAGGRVIGTNADISNLTAGTYQFSVSDSQCGNISATYTVTEQSETIAIPVAPDVQLCSSGTALLSVSNPSASSTYRLYDTEDSTTPLDEQTSGRFKITVSANRSFYVSQVNGTCESARATIKVSVGLSELNIANTFSPNGDGINDYWDIAGIENYPNATVQVFTRYGQKVFDVKGYSARFDGTNGGKKLPAGVYYYIINLSTNCNLLSGSLALIR